KQGRCPACKNAVTVPRLAPARRKVEEIEEAEVVEEVEEVDEVEYVDEDEPPRRPVGIKRRRDIEDEDDRPRRARRRDEDEEDEEVPRSRRGRGRRDEEEDEDRSLRRSSARRRRDDEDDYDYEDEEDYDDDPERRKKARAKKKRRAWKTARTGVFLNFIAMCIYTGGQGIGLLMYLFLLIGASSASLGIIGFVGILGYLVMGLTVVSWILFIVGCGYTIVSPGKHGEKGLAITSLSLGAVALAFFLYILFTIEVGPRAFLSEAG